MSVTEITSARAGIPVRACRDAYSKEHNMTVRVHAPSLTTVLELDRWQGYDVPDDAEIERTRFTVLLDTDMNEALRVQDDLRKGDEAMLRALFTLIEWSAKSEHCYILGYDFFRKEPRIAVYLHPRTS